MMDLLRRKGVAGLKFDLQDAEARVKALETFCKENGILPPPRPPKGRLYFGVERIR